MTYTSYYIREQLIETICDSFAKHCKNQQHKLIKDNAEKQGDLSTVPNGFRYKGDCYVNPYLDFLPARNELIFLHESFLPKFNELSNNLLILKKDKENLRRFCTAQTFEAETDFQFFEALPSDFDHFLQKIDRSYVRLTEPTIKSNLVNFYNTQISNRLKFYQAFELL